MTKPSPTPDPARPGRTLIKAFTFAGAILGVGLFGLVRTIVLFGAELGWFGDEPRLGPAYVWVAGGAFTGFLIGWILVRARQNQR